MFLRDYPFPTRPLSDVSRMPRFSNLAARVCYYSNTNTTESTHTTPSTVRKGGLASFFWLRWTQNNPRQGSDVETWPLARASVVLFPHIAQQLLVSIHGRKIASPTLRESFLIPARVRHTPPVKKCIIPPYSAAVHSRDKQSCPLRCRIRVWASGPVDDHRLLGSVRRTCARTCRPTGWIVGLPGAPVV